MAKTILDKIRNCPESRRDWMLERFKFAAESYTINKNYQFWQFVNLAREIYTNQFMWSILDYIHLNPVRAGLVEKTSYYIYLSTSNYVEDSGFLKIEKTNNSNVNSMEASILINAFRI